MVDEQKLRAELDDVIAMADLMLALRRVGKAWMNDFTDRTLREGQTASQIQDFADRVSLRIRSKVARLHAQDWGTAQ
jgi:hypothetical protein